MFFAWNCRNSKVHFVLDWKNRSLFEKKLDCCFFLAKETWRLVKFDRIDPRWHVYFIVGIFWESAKHFHCCSSGRPQISRLKESSAQTDASGCSILLSSCREMLQSYAWQCRQISCYLTRTSCWVAFLVVFFRDLTFAKSAIAFFGAFKLNFQIH